MFEFGCVVTSSVTWSSGITALARANRVLETVISVRNLLSCSWVAALVRMSSKNPAQNALNSTIVVMLKPLGA